MDAALLAEREAFKWRAMAVPTIENKKKKVRSMDHEVHFNFLRRWRRTAQRSRHPPSQALRNPQSRPNRGKQWGPAVNIR